MSVLFRKEINTDLCGKCKLSVVMVSHNHKFFMLEIRNVGMYTSIDLNYHSFDIPGDKLSIYD